MKTKLFATIISIVLLFGVLASIVTAEEVAPTASASWNQDRTSLTTGAAWTVYAVKGTSSQKRSNSAYGYDGYVRATTSHDSNWRITNIVSNHRYSGGNHTLDRDYY